jgi:hypothetical protein
MFSKDIEMNPTKQVINDVCENSNGEKELDSQVVSKRWTVIYDGEQRFRDLEEKVKHGEILKQHNKLLADLVRLSP